MNNTVGIGDIAALVTIVGIAVYVLGLLGLTWSITARMYVGLSTAWYAVTLIPRTVVVGQGIRIWMRWPLMMIACWALATLLLSLARYSFKLSAVGNLLAVVAGFVVVCTIVVIGRWRVRTLARRASQQRREMQQRIRSHSPDMPSSSHLEDVDGFGWLTPSQAAAVLLGYLIAAIASAIASKGMQFNDSLVQLTLEGDKILLGIVLVFIGGFLIGLPSASGVDPAGFALPEVIIIKTLDTGGNNVGRVETEGVRNLETEDVLRGFLVAHSDGYWHCFDGDAILTSIPDDAVAAVRYLS